MGQASYGMLRSGNGMIAKWLGKRMIMGTIVLIIVSFLSFFMMHAAPGNPAAAYYGAMPKHYRPQRRNVLNKPLDSINLFSYSMDGG